MPPVAHLPCPLPPPTPPVQPVRILVKRDELTLEGIKQFYVNVVRARCAVLCRACRNRTAA